MSRTQPGWNSSHCLQLQIFLPTIYIQGPIPSTLLQLESEINSVFFLQLILVCICVLCARPNFIPLSRGEGNVLAEESKYLVLSKD